MTDQGTWGKVRTAGVFILPIVFEVSVKHDR